MRQSRNMHHISYINSTHVDADCTYSMFKRAGASLMLASAHTESDFQYAYLLSRHRDAMMTKTCGDQIELNAMHEYNAWIWKCSFIEFEVAFSLF